VPSFGAAKTARPSASPLDVMLIRSATVERTATREAQMNRILKIIVAGWAIAFGSAMLVMLASMPLVGAEKALWIWEPLPLSVLSVAGLLVSARWLK